MRLRYIKIDANEFERLTAGWPLEKVGFLLRVIRVAWATQTFPLPHLETMEVRKWAGMSPRTIRRLYTEQVKEAARIILSQRCAFEKRDRDEIFEKSGGYCIHCGEAINRNNFEIDHLVPIAEGGMSDDDNLAASCKPCNRRKGASLLVTMEASHG